MRCPRKPTPKSSQIAEGEKGAAKVCGPKETLSKKCLEPVGLRRMYMGATARDNLSTAIIEIPLFEKVAKWDGFRERRKEAGSGCDIFI